MRGPYVLSGVELASFFLVGAVLGALFGWWAL